MKRLFGLLTIVTVLVVGSLAGLFYFGWWSPNGWVAKAYPIQGIDVSNHQGPINWSKVAASKVAFVYLKSTEGGDFRDRSFAENWKEAGKHGLVRGAYHYFTMKSTGREQAANMIAVVPVDPKALPPAVDLEFFGNSKDRRSVASFRKELEEFLDLVRATYGKEPVIYTDDNFAGKYLAGYPIKRRWVPEFLTVPDWKSKPRWTFWQYSERGRVPGISSYVDRNAFVGDPEDFRALTGRGKASP
ncbi:GH25 family lysozyme [soil metagenome]